MDDPSWFDELCEGCLVGVDSVSPSILWEGSFRSTGEPLKWTFALLSFCGVLNRGTFVPSLLGKTIDVGAPVRISFDVSSFVDGLLRFGWELRLIVGDIKALVMLSELNRAVLLRMEACEVCGLW